MEEKRGIFASMGDREDKLVYARSKMPAKLDELYERLVRLGERKGFFFSQYLDEVFLKSMTGTIVGLPLGEYVKDIERTAHRLICIWFVPLESFPFSMAISESACMKELAGDVWNKVKWFLEMYYVH